MKNILTVFLILILFVTSSFADKLLKVNAPDFVILDDSISIQISNSSNSDSQWQIELVSNGNSKIYSFNQSTVELKIPIEESTSYSIKYNGEETKFEIRKVPAWFSILPPLIAITMALIFKEVVISLFTGIFLGALLINGFSFSGIISAFYAAVTKYFFVALSDSGNLSVIIFSVAIGGMVSIISRNGGMQGVVDKLMRFANSARNSQLVTWFLGIAIFFDDYANTLIVGNTMRAVTDKFNVSREKLAYIVDSTAAPVASLAFITTWIGAELGYISKANESLGIDEGAYSMFLNSLEYAYYPVFTIIFMFLILWMQRDFGPMHKAEQNARKGIGVNLIEGEISENQHDNKLFSPIDITKARWYNGFVPVLTVVLVTIIGLVLTGMESLNQQMLEMNILTDSSAPLSTIWSNISQLESEGELSVFRKMGIIVGSSDSYLALIWASFSGIFIAITMTISQRIMTLNQSMEVLIEGFKTLVPAMVIIILAWSLTEVTAELHTADFLSLLFKDNINPIFMPAITFVLAALIAFSTGSSWGTMAILYPLALPTAWALCLDAGMSQPEALEIFYHVISVVLAGSVLGDHCSPISDTTILSSLASQCNHIEHVRTQLPYALVVGGISFVLSLLAHVLNLNWFMSLILGVALIYGLIKFLGKKVAVD